MLYQLIILRLCPNQYFKSHIQSQAQLIIALIWYKDRQCYPNANERPCHTIGESAFHCLVLTEGKNED